jgi:hypothetical protein
MRNLWMVVVVGMVALVGCGGDEPLTIGQMCGDVGSAVCARHQRCVPLTNSEYSECVVTFVQDCCSGDCGQPARATREVVDTCAVDQVNLSCSYGPSGLAQSCYAL